MPILISQLLDNPTLIGIMILCLAGLITAIICAATQDDDDLDE